MNGLAQLAALGANGSDIIKFLILLIKALDTENKYLPNILSVWQGDSNFWAFAAGYDSIDWLPAQYGLRSGSRPDNSKTESSSGGGCVIAGTLITLATGKMKPVEQIVQGDLLVTGKAGSIAEATSELVITPNLLSLYGVNDDEPFMSFDHVIMSQRGW
eukprot:gene26053-28440_t